MARPQDDISPMYSVGMTLGKFAPLHRGHQFLIETALSEVDHLIVVVYEAKRTIDVPLSVRAGWIRKLYPAAEVLEAAGAPEETGADPRIRALHEEFIASFLAGRRIDAFYSSEPYGEWVSRLLGCADRRVDPLRKAVPVSGTRIRGAPQDHCRYLHDLVRADLEADRPPSSSAAADGNRDERAGGS